MNDPLHRLLEMHAVFVGTGFFQGKLYDIGRYPGVIRSRRNTDRVIGEIYRFSDPQRAFEILDEYEGHRFKRKRVTIIPSGREKHHFLDLPLCAVRHAPRTHSVR
jgi:gamma-glutamylcyclotransferase (GGCT)/AIG2-like uncharacterized protein YtfP